MKSIGDEIAAIFEPFQPLPIPTVYEGVQFRSRLEARWAVFFSAAQIRWAYEFEGYQLPSGWYLPDFWLPGLAAFLEVKPKRPTEEERARCIELGAVSGYRVFCAVGAPTLARDLRYDGSDNEVVIQLFGDGRYSAPYFACEVSPGRLDFAHLSKIESYELEWSDQAKHLERAVSDARTRRFW